MAECASKAPPGLGVAGRGLHGLGEQRQPFHAVTFDGARYDCGSKTGYINANLALALEREEMADEVRAFAVDLLK